MPATGRQHVPGTGDCAAKSANATSGEQTSVSVRNATGVQSNAYAAKLRWQGSHRNLYSPYAWVQTNSTSGMSAMTGAFLISQA